MQAIRSILVVVDPKHPELLALKRAQLIAGVTQSHLHLLHCSAKAEQKQWLDALIEVVREQGYSVSGSQAWAGSPHQTVIEAQQTEGCALVIKQHIPDNPLKKAILTPDDWKLLRYCPTPVLMTKTSEPWHSGAIIAAVDAGNSDSEHRTLHDGIVSYAYDIAQLAQATAHILSAYPSPMLAAADPTFQLKETIEAFYRLQCAELQKKYAISNDQLHLVEGPADAVIPQETTRLHAVLTIIGTVARTGISGALLGNTAEVILDTIESDILVFKPDNLLEHLEDVVAQR